MEEKREKGLRFKEKTVVRTSRLLEQLRFESLLHRIM